MGLQSKKRKKTLCFLKASRAFSLLEILIVLLIIAFVFTFVSRNFIRRGQTVKSAFENLVRLNRRLVVLSKLHSKTYRLAIQLNAEGPEQYWVEKKIRSQSSINFTDDAGTSTEGEERGQPDFVLDEAFYSEPEIIFPLLSITKVESSVWKEDKIKGVVYIYYYPKGLAQETAIQFLRLDNQGRWTLYLDPVTKNFHILKKIKNLSKK